MNYQQITALANLQSALGIATDCGALDILQSDCNSPDSINDVCDSIPKSLDGIAEETPFQDLLLLWKNLGNVPTGHEGENVDQIEEEFLHFPIGTHREDIWHWFEKRNSTFIVGEVMSGKFCDEIQIPDGFSAETPSREIRAPKDEADWIAMHSEQIVYYPDGSTKAYTKGDFLNLSDRGDESHAFYLYQYCLPDHLPEDIIRAEIENLDGGNNKGYCKHSGIDTNCCPCGDHP